MKKKVICLLISAAFAASVLSGCGKKDEDAKIQDAMNDLETAMENEDDDAAMAALEELDAIMEEDDIESSAEGATAAYPADPRWADVKIEEGETAAQYYDLFIKSGMTLGDVLEEIENSEEFFEFNPYLQEELNAQTADWRDEYTIRLQVANDQLMYIKYDGDKVINLTVPIQLPGNDGDVYSYKDIPIITVQSGGATIYSLREKHPDAYYTAFGTYDDITSMNTEDVENLKDTFFSGADVVVESTRISTEGHNYVEYIYSIPIKFSWNGYLMGGETSVMYKFTVDYDEDKVVTWSSGAVTHYNENSKWTAE